MRFKRSPRENKSEVRNANVVLSAVLLDVHLNCVDDYHDDYLSDNNIFPMIIIYLVFGSHSRGICPS